LRHRLLGAEREVTKPSALFRGLCVGRIRASPGLCEYRLRCLLSCGNASGGGCLRAVLRGRPGPAGMGCARDRGPVRVQIADRVWGGADGAYNRSLTRTVTTVSRWRPGRGRLRSAG